MPETAPRKLYRIAIDIRQNWPTVHATARPYLEAMADLDDISDYYGCDRGDDIVRRFLGNAAHWRGDHARRIKAELRSMV